MPSRALRTEEVVEGKKDRVLMLYRSACTSMVVSRSSAASSRTVLSHTGLCVAPLFTCLPAAVPNKILKKIT